MQSLLRVSLPVSSPAAVHSSRQPCPASTSGRLLHVPAPCRRSPAVLHAVKDEEAELERIARQASQPDIWDNEIIGTGLKVALVAGIAAVAVFIGRLGEPIAENTIRSFPTPADYEAYEESK